MASTIDVLVPVHNGAAYLAATLEGLAAQTFTDFRVLVLDDGSSDQSLAIARALAARDPRFEVHAWPHRGLVATLNAGLALVTAPYFARQDADDISVPGRFAMQLAYFAAHTDACAISGDFIETRMNGAPHRVARWLRAPSEALDPFAVPAEEPYLHHTFLMAKTECIRAIGGYRPILLAEDADLYWRLSLHGRLVNIPEVLGVYRFHRDSVSTRSVNNAMTQAFYAQIAALSYRRAVFGQPDLVIDDALADAVFRAGDINAKCACVADLSPAESAYLHLASHAKAIDTIRVRGLPYSPDLIRDGISAYRRWRGLAGHPGGGLRRRLRRGIRHHARQTHAWGTTLTLVARYLRDVVLEPLWRRRVAAPVVPAAADRAFTPAVPPAP